MTIWLGLAFALLLSLAALAYVVWPLLNSGPAPVMVENDRLTDLLGRKDAVMTAIKELEFDYRVGKLSAEDYQVYDQRLRRQAIALIQQIEQIAPESSGLDIEMEAEIARRRKTQEAKAAPPASNGSGIDPIEAEIALRRKVIQPAPVLVAQPIPISVAAGAGVQTGIRFCTNCGNVLDSQHKFCANCGAAVAKGS
jgi:ribosomal protein S27AE